MKLPTYAVYASQDNEHREELYQEYCRINKLMPDLESSIDQFFQALDGAEPTEDEIG